MLCCMIRKILIMYGKLTFILGSNMLSVLVYLSYTLTALIIDSHPGLFLYVHLGCIY